MASHTISSNDYNAAYAETEEGRSSATIPGWPDYAINKAGQVWTGKTGEWKPMALCRRGKVWFVGLSMSGSITKFAVRDLVALTFLGPKPEGMVVESANGDRADHSLPNLGYRPPRPVGRPAGSGKVSNEQCIEIRRRRAAGEPLSLIAYALKLPHSHARRAATGKTHKHLNDAHPPVAGLGGVTRTRNRSPQ